MSEYEIQQACRRQYREEGTTNCPEGYTEVDRLRWHNEVLKIISEEMKSSMYP